MTVEEAINIALEARAEFDIPSHFTFSSAEKRIIELVLTSDMPVDQLSSPGPVYDVVAWVVTLSFDGSQVEIAAETTSRRVVRVRRSRGAAPQRTNRGA